MRRSHPQTSEVWLLGKINRGLPISQVQRLRTLNEKRQQGIMTDVERDELYALVDKSERLNVNRLKYLTLLAHRRNVTVRELMNQVGVGPVNG